MRIKMATSSSRTTQKFLDSIADGGWHSRQEVALGFFNSFPAEPFVRYYLRRLEAKRRYFEKRDGKAIKNPQEMDPGTLFWKGCLEMTTAIANNLRYSGRIITKKELNRRVFYRLAKK